MAEIKVRSREEILSKKTEREIFFTGCRIEKMQEEYEDAVRNKDGTKKRECYVNRDGEPVVHKKDIVHDDILAVIPLSGEYYSNVEKDNNYKKRLDKIIRNAMTSSLRKSDEERMKKNVDELVISEEEKVEEKVVGKEAVREEQPTEKDKKKEEGEVKDESLEAVDDAGVGEKQQKRVADQI
ncbi:hypothetical protein Hanom_Chr11g01056471 [Helianthus anomalus]